MGIIGLSVILLLYVLITLLYPFKTIEALQPFDVITEKVKAGEKLIYEGHFEIHTSKPFEVEWELIDSRTPNEFVILPQRGRLQLSKGAHTVYREVIIPVETPPGTYKLRIVDRVQLFPFRPTDKKEFITEEFEVLPPDKNTTIIREPNTTIITPQSNTSNPIPAPIPTQTPRVSGDTKLQEPPKTCLLIICF